MAKNETASIRADVDCMVRAEGLVYEYPFFSPENDSPVPAEEPPAALQGVTLSVKKGEFVAVLGRNGSGKSTFAKHINALLLPSEGVIWVNSMDTRLDENLWEIRQSAGI